MLRLFLVLYTLMLLTTGCFAQTDPLYVDFNSPKWNTMGNADVSMFDGKTVTRVLGGTAIACLDGYDFGDGTIECDMYSPSDRAFIGLAFHIQDFRDFEWVYFLPHNSGTWDAVQYEPVCNRSATWQLYHGDGFQANAEVPTHKWFHVRLDVIGDSGYVYLNNAAVPVLSFGLRLKDHKGLVGVCSYHPGTFANLVITGKEPAMVPVSNSYYDPNPYYINTWQVSEPFLGLVDDISADQKAQNENSWKIVQADERGIINLNRYFVKTPSSNTVLARTIIQSQKVQTKTLSFGFSDKVRIYLNGKQVYSGNNTYVESDLWKDRGYVYVDYASVDLPFIKGENELVMQLYEDKFGWGFTTRLDDYQGLELYPAQAR